MLFRKLNVSGDICRVKTLLKRWGTVAYEGEPLWLPQHLTEMVLYIIGLGLADEKDITVRCSRSNQNNHLSSYNEQRLV